MTLPISTRVYYASRMGDKSKKRTRLDDAKTAYHVVDALHQVSQLRRSWNDLKAALFEFLIFATAAGVALLAGWLM